MYLRSERFCIEGNSVFELVCGDWLMIATFYHCRNQKLKPCEMAYEFYSLMVGKQ